MTNTPLSSIQNLVLVLLVVVSRLFLFGAPSQNALHFGFAQVSNYGGGYGY